MEQVLQGVPGAEGIASGVVHLMEWGVPRVPHQSVEPGEVEEEVDRFHRAREWTRGRIERLQDETRDRLGPVEARIFEPQIIMLEDPEVVDGTVRYIRENHLTAARAFEWRMLELQSQWVRTAHPMVLDKLSDLEDLQIRLLHRLLDLPDPSDVAHTGGEVVIVARNLTPSLTVQLDPDHVLGIATDQGTRTSHWVLLARSLGIPTVIGLGDLSRTVGEGQQILLDGRVGRAVLDPGPERRRVHEDRRRQIRAWEKEVEVIAGLEAITADGHPVSLRANLDLPAETVPAVRHGARGVGLFRTEFLVVGRNRVPDEEEQYEAYRAIAEAFPHDVVTIRTFDLGGDKFPMFLHMPPEENPFLGWRAIRVCLDEPELFRTQLRALLRATAHGDVRIMLPLVNDVEEVRQVRALLGEEEGRLRSEGVPFDAGYELGILVETPAAALEAAELARYADFLSVGTNDLTQYTLAVDRTNARLARLFQPFHPAVIRQINLVARASRAAGIEVGVCGEMASTPLGAFLLLGLDIDALSVAWPTLPEVKKLIRAIRIDDAREAAREALRAATSEEVVERLRRGMGDAVELSLYPGRWSTRPG
jgi:phosphotransferase system enzyme I (PtsI)